MRCWPLRFEFGLFLKEKIPIDTPLECGQYIYIRWIDKLVCRSWAGRSGRRRSTTSRSWREFWDWCNRAPISSAPPSGWWECSVWSGKRSPTRPSTTPWTNSSGECTPRRCRSCGCGKSNRSLRLIVYYIKSKCDDLMYILIHHFLIFNYKLVWHLDIENLTNWHLLNSISSQLLILISVAPLMWYIVILFPDPRY